MICHAINLKQKKTWWSEGKLCLLIGIGLRVFRVFYFEIKDFNFNELYT